VFHPSGTFELDVRREYLGDGRDGSVIIDAVGTGWLSRRELDAVELSGETTRGL
jgi:hypothetical protein